MRSGRSKPSRSSFVMEGMMKYAVLIVAALICTPAAAQKGYKAAKAASDVGYQSSVGADGRVTIIYTGANGAQPDDVAQFALLRAATGAYSSCTTVTLLPVAAPTCATKPARASQQGPAPALRLVRPVRRAALQGWPMQPCRMALRRVALAAVTFPTRCWNAGVRASLPRPRS